MEYSIVGILVFAASIYALVNIFSSSAPTGTKALWILLVLLLPVLGFIVWYFAGPRGNRASV